MSKEDLPKRLQLPSALSDWQKAECVNITPHQQSIKGLTGEFDTEVLKQQYLPSSDSQKHKEPSESHIRSCSPYYY